MSERPKLTRDTDAAEFRSYYYLKEELVRFCRENGLVYVTPVVEVRNKDQRHQKMKEAVAFFDQEISMTALNPKLNDLPKLEQMMGERVEDFGQHSVAVSRKEVANG